MQFKKLFLARIGFLLPFVFSFPAGCSEIPSTSETGSKEIVSSQDVATFLSYVTDRLRREYVEPVTNDKLLEGALNGMLSGLDPHSTYLNPKHFKEVKKQTQGRYGGLGIEIMMEGGLIRVISAIPDTPAAKAGVQTGDYIVLINQEPVIGLSLTEAAEKLRGEPRTTVKLTIRRKTEQFDLTITRDDINIKPVDWRTEGEIGYIRIKTFNQETTSELHRSLREIKAKLRNKLGGFIIDLRNNPGGLLDQAVSVSDTFLSKGEIVSIRGRETQKITRFEATSPDMTNGLPLVVLINGGSASASEIVAGALQDHHRALIVGTKSFGKGSVQTVVPLTNGGALKFTTALYYTPSGKMIQKQGIIPDVIVEQLLDLQTLKENSRFRESSFITALDFNQPHQRKSPAESKTPRINLPPEEKKIDSKEEANLPEAEANSLLKPVKDYQLEQALNIIRVMTLLEKDDPVLKRKQNQQKTGTANAVGK